MDDRMARPREFDEDVVLDAAIQCFWNRGYQATSVKDLIDKTGITAARTNPRAPGRAMGI
jgi:TetR/AcrR family transcriptional regulator, transcriptional repressor for nem operon